IVGDGRHGSQGNCVVADNTPQSGSSFYRPQITLRAQSDWWAVAQNLIVTTQGNWDALGTNQAADGVAHSLSLTATYYYTAGPAPAAAGGGKRQGCCLGTACNDGYACTDGTCDVPGCTHYGDFCNSDADCCGNMVCSGNLCV